MSKTVYLITILSVALFKSETSFGQVLKKELGVCGKTMAGIFAAKSENMYELKGTTELAEEFCDNGRYEANANFVIYLYNADKKVVYDKHVYLNPWTIEESVDPKTGKFKETKLKKHFNSRIVKFPITPEMGKINSYKIMSTEKNIEFGMQAIKW